MGMLLTCKLGFEDILAREAMMYGADLKAQGKGWVFVEHFDPAQAAELCFGSRVFQEPLRINTTSVNLFVESLAEMFTDHIRPLRISSSWPYCFSACENEQLAHRCAAIQRHWLAKIRKKVSRVAKLAREGLPQGPELAQGFFVHLTDFDKAFVAFEAFSQGQKRMAMDAKAPSRSFLKLEEAFCVFAREPRTNDVVVDLGASPGGWSYSALRKGASVIAVDNGPLKEPVKSHARIRHLKMDAFTYQPHEAKKIDWLLCDLIENPFEILDLLRFWITQRWCHYFVVNLKVGRMDPIPLLRDIHDPKGTFAPHCAQLITRQLYHDREEITVMGEAL